MAGTVSNREGVGWRNWKKKKHNKTTNDKKKERKNNNSLYRIYRITSLTQAEIPEARPASPQGGAAPPGFSHLGENESWSQRSLSINYLHACSAFLGCGDSCGVFGSTKKWAKKVFPRVSTRNNVPEKKSFTGAYVQKLVLNFKNPSPPRSDFIHARANNTQIYGSKPW